MPNFEYRCAGCGHEFECLVLHSSPPPRCPSCESEDLEKQISLPSISSGTTRSRSLRDGRRRGESMRREKKHEDHKQLHRHLADEH